MKFELKILLHFMYIVSIIITMPIIRQKLINNLLI